MLAQLAKHALDWLLPPVCPATGQYVDNHGSVAPDYWSQLKFIRAPFCQQCTLPFPHDVGEGAICAACMDAPPSFRRGRAALLYDDASKQLILRFKNADQLQAVRTLAPWLRHAGADVLQDADIVMPVPLHRFRLLKRRYNQSALLARQLGRPVMLDGLVRVKATVPQGHLKRSERAANVKGVFRVRQPDAVAGKTVLLVDDVFTTGATLNACADALLAAGAAAVDVLAVARVTKEM